MLFSAPLNLGVEPKDLLEKRAQHLQVICSSFLFTYLLSVGCKQLISAFCFVFALSLFLIFDTHLTLCDRVQLTEPLTSDSFSWTGGGRQRCECDRVTH